MRGLFVYLIIVFFPLCLQSQVRDIDFYLEQAEKNSPLIHKNMNESKMVSIDLEQLNAVLSKPEISLDASVLFAPIVSHDNGSSRFEWVSEGATNYNGYDQAFTDGGQYQAVVSIKQPLLNKSIHRSYSNQAFIKQEINQNNIELTSHELEQVVGYQYLLCLKAKMQIQNAQLVLNQVDEQLGVLQKLVTNAIYKQTDLMLLLITRGNYLIDYQKSKAEYRTSIYDLNLICGISDTTVVDIREHLFEIKPDTLTHSKFITGYKLDSLGVLAEQSVFEQKYKPQLYFFANAGLNAIYLPTIDRLGFSTGITFNWTIFDGHQRKIQQQKALISMDNIEFEKQNFITQHTINKRKILDQIQASVVNESIVSEQVKQYELLIDTYKKELAMGQLSIMDLKNVLNDLAAKKQELLLITMERQVLINSYNYWNY